MGELHRHRCTHLCECRLPGDDQCLSCDIRDFERHAEDFVTAAVKLGRSGREVAKQSAHRVVRDIEAALAADPQPAEAGGEAG